MRSTLRWIMWSLLLLAVLYTGGYLSRVANAPSPPTTYWVTDVQPAIVDFSDARTGSETKVTIVLGYEGPRPELSTAVALFDYFLMIDDHIRPAQYDKQSLNTDVTIDTKRSEVRLCFDVPAVKIVDNANLYLRAVPKTDDVNTPPIWIPIRTAQQDPEDVVPLGAVARVELTGATTVVPETDSEEPPIQTATPDLITRLQQTGGITGSVFADNGERALLRTRYQVYLWDIVSGQVSLVWSNNRRVYAAVLSSDHRFFAVSESNNVWVVDLLERRIVHRLPTDKGDDPAAWLALTPDGNGVYAVCPDTHVYNIDSRDPVHVIGHCALVLDRKRERFRQAAISLKDDRLVTFTQGANTVQVWRLPTGTKLSSVDLKHSNPESWSGCAFSHDTRQFALAGFFGDVTIWDTDSGHESLRVVELPGMPQSHGPVAFSYDGSILAVTDANERQVYLLETSTGEVLMCCPPLSDRGPRSSHVDAISFSKSGRLLIVQSAEVPQRPPGIRSVSRVATVWDLARIRTLRRRFDQ